MTLDHLRKEIRQEAARQRKEALKDAQSEAARIVSEAESTATVLVEEARKKADDEAMQKQSQVSAARLEGKKRLAEARDHVVAVQLADVKDALKDFADSSKYDAVLKDLAAQGAASLGGKVRLWVRKKDVPKMKKWGYLDVVELDSWGGCVVESADGRIRINNTFEALFEQSVDKLRQAIFEEL